MLEVERLIELAEIVYNVKVRGKRKILMRVWAERAIFVALKSEKYTLKAIAAEFNKEQHATIIHSLNKHKILYSNDKMYKELFDKFERLAGLQIFTPKNRLIMLIESLNVPNEIYETIASNIKKYHLQ